MQRDTFILLDGLRGLGALIVVMGHTIYLWGMEWNPGGAVVVDLFFLLSGFVLAYAYEPRFVDGMGVREFMTHRIVRLYPLYLLGTLLTFLIVFGATLGDADAGERQLSYTLQLIPQLFMLPSPEALGTIPLYSMNPPAWTLFFELVVNLLYVAAFRWLRDTRVLAALVLFCGVGLVVTVFALGSIDVGSHWPTWWAGFWRAGFGFFAGVLAFRLVGSPRTAIRPAKSWSILLVVLLPVICLIPATPEMQPVVDLTFAVVLAIPLLILAQSAGPPTWLNTLFTVGGRISYAVYILHQPFRELAERAPWRGIDLLAIAPLGGVAILVSVVVLSYFAERYYDRPVRRLIVAKLRQRETQKAAASRTGMRAAKPMRSAG